MLQSFLSGDIPTTSPSEQNSSSPPLNFQLISLSIPSLKCIESHDDASRLPWIGPVPGDIAEVEAYCRIFRNSERLHNALMDALCNSFTGECSVSDDVPSHEKPVLEDKIVSVLGSMVALVKSGREDVLAGRFSVMYPFRASGVGRVEETLPPLAVFRSEMKRCFESLHVALENYLVPGDEQNLDVWRKLQRLKNVCYDSGFPRGEDYPCPALFANWNPVYFSSSEEDLESKESKAAFWIGGQVTEEGLKWLLDRGYKTIVDLREETVKDNFYQAAVHDAVSSGSIELVKIPVEVGTSPKMEQVERFASLVSDISKRPIYLHTKEGVWRTSAMVSRWREYMAHAASHYVSSQTVISNDISAYYTTESGKLQDSITAERSFHEKDSDLLQEGLGSIHSSVDSFDESTSPNKNNEKTE